jgi:hypothetical protein
VRLAIAIFLERSQHGRVTRHLVRCVKDPVIKLGL